MFLFCIQYLPCSVRLRCMLGGSLDVCMKNILYHLIERQTHFGMPRGAKMSPTLIKPKKVAFESNTNTTSEYAPQVERDY